MSGRAVKLATFLAGSHEFIGSHSLVLKKASSVPSLQKRNLQCLDGTFLEKIVEKPQPLPPDEEKGVNPSLKKQPHTTIQAISVPEPWGSLKKLLESLKGERFQRGMEPT